MVEKPDMTISEREASDIPIRRLASLEKDIRKYEEYVNKCDIVHTNDLAEGIGGDIVFLRYSEIGTTLSQKQELRILEDIFTDHMNNLKKCRCIKRIEK